ncbi:unnamed protein product, partial [Scytosiphon promiscuus]
MEVRWRLFARDVLSLLADDAGEFYFGRPPRPVRGLRLLGVVVHRARRAKSKSTAVAAVVSFGDGCGLVGDTHASRGGGSGCSSDGGSAMEGDFGLVGIDDGTGVVEVRLPLRCWETIALGDQVDIVGTLERVGSPAFTSRSSKPVCIAVNAEGCYAEADPNIATLRALECINLYKSCYFSRAWSPSGVALPPLLPDPQPVGDAHGHGRHGEGSVEEGGIVDDPALELGDRAGGGDEKATALEARVLGLIGSMGRATAEQLANKLGLPPGHAGVASALGQA